MSPPMPGQSFPCVPPTGHRTYGSTLRTQAPSSDSKVALEPDSLPEVKVVGGVAPQAWEGELLLLAVTEEDVAMEGDAGQLRSERLKALDTEAGGALLDCVAGGGFEGKQGSHSKVVRLGAGSGVRARYVGLLGLGKAAKVAASADWGTSCFKALGTTAASVAKAQRVQRAALAVLEPPSCNSDAGKASALTQIASGLLLGGYESSRFKSKKSPTASKLAALDVLSGGLAAPLAVSEEYLVEAPPNICTPTHLAEAAQHVASLFPDTMQLKVLEKQDCAAMNMGLYLGVAEASDEPPKFIHLTYTAPGEGPKKSMALVGKGLTFDSGGYNLKAGPGSMIEIMKFDMGGAAATLGAARIIGHLAPPGVQVHFIIAACENMVAGHGLRPGDILTSASGKTVEVNNTDAEGRLTLADALWYAQEKCGATTVVDTATLTGACIIALGGDIAGLFTPSDAMAAALSAAAKTTGEKVWRMPMEPGYWEVMKSPCADMKNAGSRGGGSITAALFLQQYVNEGVEWAHLDIAGPVWDEKAGLPTGYGAALSGLTTDDARLAGSTGRQCCALSSCVNTLAAGLQPQGQGYNELKLGVMRMNAMRTSDTVSYFDKTASASGKHARAPLAGFNHPPNGASSANGQGKKKKKGAENGSSAGANGPTAAAPAASGMGNGAVNGNHAGNGLDDRSRDQDEGCDLGYGYTLPGFSSLPPPIQADVPPMYWSPAQLALLEEERQQLWYLHCQSMNATGFNAMDAAPSSDGGPAVASAPAPAASARKASNAMKPEDRQKAS
ncbi:cytosol_AP domain-containing protein [Haematococcus lacustris]|uniref:Cytosol_AP domain-containing protein n=1 Tax=Haematococcus lacustris TaxID=44745 RepID=A0A699ZXD7_HAELA|nr:cytosol_AP domain-containing protein [Haematococcus lacustris]